MHRMRCHQFYEDDIRRSESDDNMEEALQNAIPKAEKKE